MLDLDTRLGSGAAVPFCDVVLYHGLVTIEVPGVDEIAELG